MVDTDNDLLPVGALLRDVARLHVQAQRAGAACCGAGSEPRCRVLGELARGGPLGLVELAARLGADKGWTSRAVAGLHREGLVVRRSSAEDGRAIRVALTPVGRAGWRAMDAALNRHAAAAMRGVPARERAAVGRALALVRASLADHLAGAVAGRPAPDGGATRRASRARRSA